MKEKAKSLKITLFKRALKPSCSQPSTTSDFQVVTRKLPNTYLFYDEQMTLEASIAKFEVQKAKIIELFRRKLF